MMPEDAIPDSVMQMRNYVDDRLDRLSDESARTAALLAQQPADAVSLREHIEGRLDRVARENSVFLSALRELYDERIGTVESNLQETVRSLEKTMELRFKNSEMAVTTAISAVQEFDKMHTTGHAQEHEATARLVNASVHAIDVKVDGAVNHIEESMAEHRSAHDKERLLSDRANDKLEQAIAERFEALNHQKEASDRDRSEYARRDTTESLEKNTRSLIDKLDSDTRTRVEKLEADFRQRHESLAEAHRSALAPILTWQANMSGRIAVWGVMATVFITLIVFLANYITTR